MGASWTWKYDDQHTLTIGAEYFYNSLGYADPAIYPWLIFNNQYDPFYVGRNQVGLYVLLPKPFQWYDTTFIFSTLANLSDTTFISRIDYSVLLLTYLRLEAYASVHYGNAGRRLPPRHRHPRRAALPAEPVNYPTPVADFGVALRLACEPRKRRSDMAEFRIQRKTNLTFDEALGQGARGAQGRGLRRAHPDRREGHPEAEDRRRLPPLPHPRRLQPQARLPGAHRRARGGA